MMKKNRTGKGVMDTKEQLQWNFKRILKDVETFSASHMTWKERKELENQNIVSLGGKSSKKQRLPLSVARLQMKKQKAREQKILHENSLMGHYDRKLGGGARRRSTDKRRPEERILKATEGHFRNGVLDVRHLLHSAPAPATAPAGEIDSRTPSKGVKKGSRKKQKGKKGGGKKRH